MANPVLAAGETLDGNVSRFTVIHDKLKNVEKFTSSILLNIKDKDYQREIRYPEPDDAMQ